MHGHLDCCINYVFSIPHKERTCDGLWREEVVLDRCDTRIQVFDIVNDGREIF